MAAAVIHVSVPPSGNHTGSDLITAAFVNLQPEDKVKRKLIPAVDLCLITLEHVLSLQTSFELFLSF